MDDGRDPGRDHGGNAGDGDGHDEHVDLIALVLGHADARGRAQMAAHLLVCPSCRRDYDEMSPAVGELLAVVPAVQPPLGFDQQVLTRLGIGRPRRRLGSRFMWAATTAAAVIALVALIAGIGWWRAAQHDGSTAGDVSTLQLADGGSPVGTVSIGDVRGERVMVVALVTAPQGASYRCRTTFVDGTTTESDPWAAEYGAWIVPLPDSTSGEIQTVELVVDGTDHVWSSASFGTSD